MRALVVLLALCACREDPGSMQVPMPDASTWSPPPQPPPGYCFSDSHCDEDEYCQTAIGKCWGKMPNGASCLPIQHHTCLSNFCNPNTSQCSDPVPPGGCNVPVDCGYDGACRTWTCESLRCVKHDRPADTQLTQSSGDCRARSCDGAGNLVETPDDTDVPPSTVCTQRGCSGGSATSQWIQGGTSCGPDGEVCHQGRCSVPSVAIKHTPYTTAPIDGRLVSGGVEVTRCTSSCQVEATYGQQFTLEVTSPWGADLDCATAPCTFSAFGAHVFYAEAKLLPRAQWTFLGEPGEVFRAATYDNARNLLAGSDRRLIKLDPYGVQQWAIAGAVSSLVHDVARGATYVLRGDQLARLDAQGNVVWQQTADTCPNADEFPSCLALAPNGDIVFGGPRAMRWTSAGVAVFATPRDSRWAHNSVAVNTAGVTHLLRSDTGTNGMVASRIASDGTPLPDLVDAEAPPFANASVRFGNGTERVTVGYMVNGSLQLRSYRSDGFVLARLTRSIGAQVPFAILTRWPIPYIAYQLDPVLGGFHAIEMSTTWTTEYSNHLVRGRAGAANPLGVRPHAIANGPAFAVLGQYQGFDQPVGWIQTFENPIY